MFEYQPNVLLYWKNTEKNIENLLVEAFLGIIVPRTFAWTK